MLEMSIMLFYSTSTELFFELIALNIVEQMHQNWELFFFFFSLLCTSEVGSNGTSMLLF
jgi:hypothetical protein